MDALKVKENTYSKILRQNLFLVSIGATNIRGQLMEANLTGPLVGPYEGPLRQNHILFSIGAY